MLTAMAVELLSKHPGETPAGGARPTPWLPPMKLLLIEDNPALQATLTRSFERRGIQGVGCDDGARALDRWHASQPDVVLLDLNLPGLDGLPVLSQARAQGLDTPVIILTARGTVGDRILGLNTGADDHLPKPFDLDELEARVQALARRRTVDAQPPAAGHLAAGGCTGGAQQLAPVPAGPARGRYRLRPHPAGLGPGDW